MLQGDYWMNIKHDYYIKKLSISEIARIYGIDRKTVRRYLKAIDKPRYTYKNQGTRQLKTMLTLLMKN